MECLGNVVHNIKWFMEFPTSVQKRRLVDEAFGCVFLRAGRLGSGNVMAHHHSGRESSKKRMKRKDAQNPCRTVQCRILVGDKDAGWDPAGAYPSARLVTGGRSGVELGMCSASQHFSTMVLGCTESPRHPRPCLHLVSGMPWYTSKTRPHWMNYPSSRSGTRTRPPWVFCRSC